MRFKHFPNQEKRDNRLFSYHITIMSMKSENKTRFRLKDLEKTMIRKRAHEDKQYKNLL